VVIDWWNGVDSLGVSEDGGYAGDSLRSIKPLVLTLNIIPVWPAFSMTRLGSHRSLMFRQRDKAKKSVPDRQSCSIITTEPMG
jgi:hypothetical protein